MEKITRRPQPRSRRNDLPEGARSKKLGILLANEMNLVRDALRSLINSQRDMEVVAEASGEGLERIQPVKPDVAVLDVSVPPLTSLTIARSVLRHYPGLKLVVLAGREEVSGFPEPVRASIHGYVCKESTGAEFLQAIRKAARDEAYFDSRVTTKADPRHPARLSDNGSNAPHSLTLREETVLRLVALGHSNKAIASKLSLSPKTVESHKLRIGKKLGNNDRVHMVQYASRRGWLAEAAVFSPPS